MSVDRTVRTDVLDVAVRLAGPGDGPVVLLLHGWPDDASTWDGVLPALHDAGLRTVTPSLRGFGATRFREDGTPRTGNSGVLALDAVALMDALGVERFAVAGHDWGANTAEAMAVGWPRRVRRIALLSTPPRLGGMPTPPFWHAQLEWYHWFMATERGAAAVRDDPKGFAHVMWENWSPPGWFDEETFGRVSDAWENPDWVAVTLHSYRARWDQASPDETSIWLEKKVKSTDTLELPTVYVQGEVDGVNPPQTSEAVGRKFTGPFERVVLPGVGHFPTRETPNEIGTRLAKFFSVFD